MNRLLAHIPADVRVHGYASASVLRQGSLRAACALLFVLMFIGSSQAGTYTWTGNAYPDAKWTTAANWQGNAAPNFNDASEDTLVFPAGPTHTNMTNDFPQGSTVKLMQFGAGYVLGGQQIRIKDGINVAIAGSASVVITSSFILDGGLVANTVVLNTNALLMLDGLITGSATATLRVEGTGRVRLGTANSYEGSTIVVGGRIDLAHPNGLGSSNRGTFIQAGTTLQIQTVNQPILEPLVIAGTGSGASSGAVYLQSTGNTLMDVAISDSDAAINTAIGTTVIQGGISGVGGLVKRGGGTLVMTGAAANTYGGLTRVSEGTISLQKAGSIAIPNSVVIDKGLVQLAAANAIEGHVTIAAPGMLELNGHSDTIASLTGPGPVRLGTGTLTVSHATQSSNFDGAIADGGSLVKSGAATMSLFGANTFTGGMTINAGRVNVMGSLASPVTLADGILRGGGSLGALIANGGEVRPGHELGVAHRVLRSHAVTLNAASALAIALSDDTPTGHTELRVTGAVTINHAALVLNVASGVYSASLTIVDNDGNDAVTGTFAGLPEGALVNGNGRSFRVSYVGGTGNDVVLTPAVSEYHLSEGATGPFFDTDLLIANPNGVDEPIEVRFLKPGGEVVTQQYVAPAMSRMTIRVDDITGLESTEVSTIVKPLNGLPLVVERTMRWGANGYGAHTEKAVDGPSLTWHFAEGAQGFFSTYLLLANPNAGAITASVEYLRENTTPIVRLYDVGALARLTVDMSADAELVNQSFGMKVTFSQPAVAERSMYFGTDPFWKAGHESAGVPAPSTGWFLAEGATGAFFETFVLLANPQDVDAEVAIRFLPEGGNPITKNKTLAAHSRLTVNIEGEDPALANAAVATSVVSTQPIVVERAQYWPDPAPQWYEAHNSFGLTEAGLSWGLAEGRVGGPEQYQTYILIANPDTKSSTVTLTFLREGKPAFDKTFNVAASSRFTVSTGPGSLVPELQDERFGVKLTANEPVVVERAMYANAGGQQWGSGTNATGTRLP